MLGYTPKKTMEVTVFKANQMESLVISYGKNLTENSLSTISKMYDLVDENGCVELYQKGSPVMRTSKITNRTVFAGEPQNAPVKVQSPYGTVAQPL